MLDCQVEKATTKSHAQPKRTRIVGCSEQMQLMSQKEEVRTGPEPWAVRKFAVGLVIGIYFYSYYVFVVRICVKMVRMSDPARLGDRAQGIAYLVIFHFLFCMFVWSYSVAITTSPGFARDYVLKTDAPVEEEELVQVEGYRFENLSRQKRLSNDGSQPEANGYAGVPHNSTAVAPPLSMGAAEPTEEQLAEEHGSAGALGPSFAAAAAISAYPTSEDAQARSSPAASSATANADEVAVTFPPKAHTTETKGYPPRRESHDSNAPSFLHFPEPPDDYEPSKQRPLVDRAPPQVPVLTDKYRYDSREGILRPYRSHRCKHCAAVVLKMDHHCPWVGSCVGARNYKYFYNFLQWSFLYTAFLLITMIIANATPLDSDRPYPGVDAQQVVIIAFSGLFAVFTGSLLVAHTRLIMLNMTTIEDMGLSRVRARERSALDRVYGFWGLRAKHRVRKEWNQHWGRLGREGNLWWLGSPRANWEMVMGKHKSAWILPIPAKPKMDDGLSYIPNPRFSKEGYWRPRREWPAELR